MDEIDPELLALLGRLMQLVTVVVGRWPKRRRQFDNTTARSAPEERARPS